MANAQFVDVELYSHWASALVNNDYSGLDEADIAELEGYVENERADNGMFVCTGKVDNNHFGQPDIRGALPGEIATYTFQVA
jgi:hypothetical protein